LSPAPGSFCEEGGIFYVHTAAWQREQQERSEQERTRRQLDAPLVSHSIPFLMPMPGSCKKTRKNS
jgi:protein transport protein HofQ